MAKLYIDEEAVREKVKEALDYAASNPGTDPQDYLRDYFGLPTNYEGAARGTTTTELPDLSKLRDPSTVYEKYQNNADFSGTTPPSTSPPTENANVIAQGEQTTEAIISEGSLTVMDFVWFFLGYLVSSVTVYSFAQVVITIRCALPIVRNLKRTDNIYKCMRIRAAERMYLGATVFNLGVCILVSVLMLKFAPKMMILGYMVAFAIQLLMNFGRYGKSRTNIEETFASLSKYVTPGMEEDFAERFEYAQADAPVLFPIIKVIALVWILGGMFVGAYFAK